MKKTICTSLPLNAIWSKSRNKADLNTALIFLDWLYKSGQKGWQLLPINETQLEANGKAHVPSPYKGYGIGIDPKYLSDELKKIKLTSETKSYFIKKHKEWILDYSLFCALRDKFKTDDWSKWPEGIKNRQVKAIENWQNKLKKEISQHILIQYQLEVGFEKIREKAREYNIKMIGDIPFYLGFQSPLVWKFQKAFQIKEGLMTKVSGLPDGPNAHFGRQVWGHPLYNWNQKAKVLKLWEIRLKYNAQLFDIVRLDHAKGLFFYGSMDIKNHKKDSIEKGPGANTLKEIINAGHQMGISIFAEDSGDRLDELRKVLDELNIAGIRIARFAYNEKKAEINERYANFLNYPPNTFAQTSTHDTETLMGYLNNLSADKIKKIAEAMHISYHKNKKEFAINLRQALIQSPAHWIVIPMQDWLLTTDRINIPGTEKKTGDLNWKYKVSMPIEDYPLNLFKN